MKLKKIIIDGKVYYTEDENVDDSITEEITVDEEEVDEEDCDKSEKKKSRVTFGDGVRIDGQNLGDYLNEKVFKKIPKLSDFEELDSKFNPKTKSIAKILPFMSEEDLEDLANKILNEEEKYKDINLTILFPFLSTEYCDKLFVKALESENKKFKYMKLAPFVSQECLSLFVTKYLDGKYNNVNIDYLYPFLSSTDIKRIFDYKINKE